MPSRTQNKTPAVPRAADASAPDSPTADGRKAQLLVIARRHFARMGYDATALSDIADEAKVTKAALYYYFPNKDALYERVVIDSMNALLAEVTSAVDRAPTPTEKVRTFLHASADFMESRRDEWLAGSNAFWQSKESGRREIALSQRDSYERLLRGCLESGIRQGELRAVDPAMAGRLMLAGLNQMVRWHRTGGPLSAREVIDQYLDITLLGLVNRGGVAQPAPSKGRAKS